MTSRFHRLPVVVVVVLLVALASVSAYAAWSTSGTSGGRAYAATLTAATGVTADTVPGSGSVAVAWSAPSGTLVPQGYSVRRTRTSDSTSSYACGTSATSLLSGLSCTDSGMPDGTYTYVVTAVFGSWSTPSAPSAAVVVSTDVATTTTVVSSANPSVSGQTVTYTATVAPGSGTTTPSGTVTFKDAGTAISCAGGVQVLDASGRATCQVAYSGPGSHQVTAAYARTAGFAASTSGILSQTVSKAATTITLTSTPNPSVNGQTVTYTATVAAAAPGAGTPTGTVSFRDGATALSCTAGSPTLNASRVATCQVSSSATGSTHSITAAYAGDSTFTGSTSAALSQVVNQAATTTSVTSSANPAVVGQPVTLTATVSVSSPGTGTPTGTVAFKSGASTISCTGGSQTLSAGTATCTTSFTSPGTSTLTAVYSGDTADATSTSASLSQAVNAASTSTTVTSSANPATIGQTVTYTATVTAASPGSGTPTGTVTFKDGASTVACTGGSQTLSAGTATCSLVYGTSSTSHPITAVYAGTTSYASSTSPLLNEVVTSATSTALVPSTTSTVKTGQTLTFTATVTATPPGTGVPSGTVAFKDGATTISCSGGTQTLNGLGVATCATTFSVYGNHAVTAVYSGAAGYAASSSTAVTQKVVNGTVAGLVFTGIAGATGTCAGTVTASSSCSVVGASNAVVSASVAFADSNGTLIPYSADTQVLGYTISGRNTGSGSVSVAGGTSTTTTAITATKQGNNSETVTVTFSDGVSSFTTVLNIG